MPTGAAPVKTLKGKTGPDCLYAMSCALACRHAGGYRISKAGQAMTQALRSCVQQGKNIYKNYMYCMPAHEDESVTMDKELVKRVAEGLTNAAAGFEQLPAALRDEWSLHKWDALPPVEQVRPGPHVGARCTLS